MEDKKISDRYIAELRVEVNEMVPCLCDEGFKCRNLVDPQCPRCNWYDDEFILSLVDEIERLRVVIDNLLDEMRRVDREYLERNGKIPKYKP